MEVQKGGKSVLPGVPHEEFHDLPKRKSRFEVPWSRRVQVDDSRLGRHWDMDLLRLRGTSVSTPTMSVLPFLLSSLTLQVFVSNQFISYDISLLSVGKIYYDVYELLYLMNNDVPIYLCMYNFWSLIETSTF